MKKEDIAALQRHLRRRDRIVLVELLLFLTFSALINAALFAVLFRQFLPR